MPDAEVTRTWTHSLISTEPIANPVSDEGEDWFQPDRRMYAPPNTARSLDMDRYSSSSHMALTLSSSQDLTSDVLDISDNAQSPSSQLHSTLSLNCLPMSPRSRGNFSDLLPRGSIFHLGQELEAASTEPVSQAIRFSIKTPPVLPALPQSGSIAAVAGKENSCRLCGTHFTQSQVLNRHMKDKHQDKGSCPHCSNFKWSRGRPYLYRKHLQEKHSGLMSSEDPPRGTCKAQVSRAQAHQFKAPNKDNQVTRGLVP
ncbi:hypothetical protein H4582DRAFT_2184919 [Lactarius indigo]|nr:hypothetical protein H4582DRAFT_2184919 [Lactarius indigo]